MGFFASSGILNQRGFFSAPVSAAPPAFSPTDISGLQLWLDATTGLFDATSGGSAVTTDGSAVARWEDQSGNGNHFTQSTSNNRPILKTSFKNSKNVLYFDGANDFLGSSISVNYPMTFVAVSWPVSDNVSYRVILAGNNNDMAFGYDNNNRAFWFTTTGNAAARARPTTFEIYFAVMNGASSRLIINNNFDNTWSVTNVNMTTMRLVSNFIRENENYFAEALVYNSALSNSSITSLRDYLNSKWSVY